MVVNSGNPGSAPLIGSKVIRDRASNGSVWSEKGPRIRPTPEPDQSCVQSKAGQMPEWSEKAPLFHCFSLVRYTIINTGVESERYTVR